METLSSGDHLLALKRVVSAERYLGDVKVEAKALSFPLHLPHAQLAGELTGAEAESLQSECAVQVPLGTVPDVVERDLLQKEKKKTTQHAQAATQRRSQIYMSETRHNRTTCLEYAEIIINYTDTSCHC